MVWAAEMDGWMDGRCALCFHPFFLPSWLNLWEDRVKEDLDRKSELERDDLRRATQIYFQKGEGKNPAGGGRAGRAQAEEILSAVEVEDTEIKTAAAAGGQSLPFNNEDMMKNC